MLFYVETFNKTSNAEKALQHVGDYETLPEAIAASKRTIDAALLREYTAGMTGVQLLEKYQSYGDMPAIFRTDDQTLANLGFSALKYARERSLELCGK